MGKTSVIQTSYCIGVFIAHLEIESIFSIKMLGQTLLLNQESGKTKLFYLFFFIQL